MYNFIENINTRRKQLMFPKILSILLLISPLTVPGLPAAAETEKKYTPTTIEREPVSDSEAGGSRGCSQAMGTTPLIFLIPRDQVQPTLSRHPTFVWYLPQPVSVPLRFTLIQPGTTGIIYRQEIQADQAGIFRLKLPASLPELRENQEYRWTVTLVCNDLKPSSNISLWAWLKPISASGELQQRLNSARSRNEKSRILSEAKLWHDVYDVWFDSVSQNKITILSKTFLPEEVQRQLRQQGVFSLNQQQHH